MCFDLAISEITADTGKFISSQDIMRFTERHPLRFDGGSHKGDRWNIECQSTVQWPRIVADKRLTLSKERKKIS